MGSLKVTVHGIRSNEGQLRVLLFDSPKTWLLEDKAHKAITHTIPSGDFPMDQVLSFEGIEAGEYAVMVVHDLKKKGKLDTNLIGMPRDGVAASNGAKGGPLGGPRWNVAVFKHDGKTTEIELKVFYIFK